MGSGRVPVVVPWRRVCDYVVGAHDVVEADY